MKYSLGKSELSYGLEGSQQQHASCRWTIPTNIPVSVLGGKSLFGEFLGSIGANLAHFPKGPALTDRFWLYFIVYHVGLFTSERCLPQ